MPGQPITLGPFTKGLHNSAGTGEYISNDELFELVNLEVDTDGSLANRPAISTFNLPAGIGTDFRLLGVYLPSTGNRYLIITYVNAGTYAVGMLNIDTNTLVASNSGYTNFMACGVQYNDRFYVYPSPGTTDTGGYFAGGLWVVKALPGGQASACVIYKERLFAVAGVGATANTSRMYFSAVADPTSFVASNYFDFEPGNGQKISNIVVLNNDLIVFKEHSTYRAGYTSDVAKMEISAISTTIGSPQANCVEVYDNNNVYILHDNSIYEMYNFAFTKISSNLSMDRIVPVGVDPTRLYGLSLFRNRLLVRFYSRFYVLSLLSNRWASWESTKQFNDITVLPDSSGDVAFAASIANVAPEKGNIYRIIDDRLYGIQVNEDFECRITTKTYDFDISYAYKVLFLWGMTIATSGQTTATVQSPNASVGKSWNYMKQNYTWQQAKDANIPWSITSKVLYQSTLPATGGGYSRKFLKFNQKMRFRQAFFQVATKVRPNTVGDAAVRIFDLTVFLKQKEFVVKETTA